MSYELVNSELRINDAPAQATLAKNQEQAAKMNMQIEQKQHLTEMRWLLIGELGARILRKYEESTAAMVAVKAIELVQFGVSIRRIALESQAAFTAHQYLRGTVLAGIVATMIGLKVEAEMLTHRLKEQSARFTEIRVAMEAYK